MPDALDALTLDETLEQMLPLCDDDPFEVADWLNDHLKRGKVRLLAEGVPVPPHICETELAIVAKVASDRRATLEVASRGRPLSRVKGHYEVIVGYDKSGEPNKQFRELTEPIKQWTVERRSFEFARSNTKRSGRPLTKREWVLIEAATYIVENGLPKPPTAEALYNELASIHGAQCPSRALAMEVLPSLVRRIKDVLGR